MKSFKKEHLKQEKINNLSEEKMSNQLLSFPEIRKDPTT